MAFVTICRILISVSLVCQIESGYELYSIGCQLELENKVEEAIDYYHRALKLSPSSPEIYLSLANALYKLEQFDKGIETVNQGLQYAQDTVEMYNTIAIGYIGKGDYKSAVFWYNKIRLIDPDQVDVYISLSILYEAIREPENARDILLALPDSIATYEIYERLGTLSGKLKDHEAAISYYRRSLEMDTTNATALTGIATGFDILEQTDSAIVYYEKALQEDTLILTVGRRLAELYMDTDKYNKLIYIATQILAQDYFDGHIRRNLGFAYYKMDRMEDALQEFLIASRIDHNDTYSRFYAARIYLDQGNYRAAVSEIEDALEINPDFIELWAYLGFISIERNDYKTAEYAFSEAAHRGADLVQVFYLLGVVAEMKRNYETAYFHYHRALRESPDNLASLEALANLCERLDKKNEAFTVFKRIIEVDTAHAAALNYVGYTYAERNDSLQYALGLIERAINIDEDNAYFIDSRGWVYYQMGRYEEARDELERAAGISEDPVILEHLGDVYVKLNEHDKAQQVYQRALEFDPKNSLIKHKIDALK
jgi:tetratricopeptide (TPR) repeat protein